MESIEFVDVLSHDEFRDIIRRYKPHRLGPLRDALIAKSNDIQDQRLTPMSQKTNRDGSLMDDVEYEDWSAKARTAQNCTDRQIQIVTEQMRQPHNWGNGSLLDAMEDLCVNVEDNGEDRELSPAARIVRHYLNSVNQQRSNECHS
jgi:hypothetical protein